MHALHAMRTARTCCAQPALLFASITIWFAVVCCRMRAQAQHVTTLVLPARQYSAHMKAGGTGPKEGLSKKGHWLWTRRSSGIQHICVFTYERARCRMERTCLHYHVLIKLILTRFLQRPL